MVAGEGCGDSVQGQSEGYYSLAELCKEISISMATGRNWLRLGKLQPSVMTESGAFFASEYVNQLKNELVSLENPALKSRRNKKYVSGRNVYSSYVSEGSKNILAVQSVLDSLLATSTMVTDEIIKLLLSECTAQLIYQKCGHEEARGGCLQEYLTGELELKEYAFLVEDLLHEINLTVELENANRSLFSIRYTYVENEDILGLLYISLSNIGSRKAKGCYYTPTSVVKRLCGHVFEEHTEVCGDVLDPCCGTGNFLLQLPDSIPFQNIYGNDIDEISVQLTRINLALKYGLPDKNMLYEHISCSNYLIEKHQRRSNIIIGNPPWGYEFTEEEKEQLRNKYFIAKDPSIESSDAFIERALSNLQHNGILSFVLPEAILNVKSHMLVRKLIMKGNNLQRLDFLGNAFHGVQCPSVILQVIHNGKPFTTAGMRVEDGPRSYTISMERMLSRDFICLRADDREYTVLEKISYSNQLTLKGKADFALGIVTGRNKQYISQEKKADNEAVLRGKDIFRYAARKPKSYIEYKPEAFQQAALEGIYRAQEKLFYRYICSQLVFAYDDNQTLSLNSCNILIPHIEGMNTKYIMAVLNSRVAQFFFKKQFGSLKVLRSHIELIPIPEADDEVQNIVIGLVDELIDAEGREYSEAEMQRSHDKTKKGISRTEEQYNKDRAEVKRTYNRLDRIIVRLYGLSEDEYQLVERTLDGERLYL